jgi:hypothetical protein
MHSTQTECKKAHNSALEEFKTARVTMPAIAEQIITSTPTIRELLEETYIIDLTNLSDDNCTSTRELHEYLHAKGVMSSEAKVGRELAKLGLVGFSKKKEGKTIRLWSGIQSDTSSSTKLLHMKHVVPQPVTSTSTGYVYCFANESMPGILKIGMTTRTPLDRLEEANSSDTWKPPTPYTVELAKSVSNPKDKENTIHKLLEKYSEKIHDRREFFRISVDDVRLFFDLMDGEYWSTSPTQEKSNTKRKIKKKATVAPKN